MLGPVAALTAGFVLVSAASADGGRGDDSDRISALEAQLQVIAQELDKLRREQTVPEEKKLESHWGLGPAASKVYTKERGLSIGGYGEIVVGVPTNGTNVSDLQRFVLYTGYKFSDRILMNTEVEFEHSGTGGGGSVSLEFAALDFLLRDEANLRAGLLLHPMGFINEIHEPPFYLGVARPEIERRIIPTTWREIGAGVFGEIGDSLSYRAYGITGLDATGFADTGLRGGRQRGSRALAEDWAFTGRLDWTPLGGLLLGASVYAGNSGQNQTVDDPSGGPGQVAVPDAFTTIWEVHANYEWKKLHLRGIWTQAHVADAGALSTVLGLDPAESVARLMRGGYAEIGYDVLPLMLPDTRMQLEPYYRLEYIDTQAEVASGFVRNKSQEDWINTFGVQYKPHPQVVIKTDYRIFNPVAGESSDVWSLGAGFVF